MSRAYRNSGTYRSRAFFRGADVVGYIVDVARNINRAMKSQANAPRNRVAPSAPKSKTSIKLA